MYMVSEKYVTDRQTALRLELAQCLEEISKSKDPMVLNVASRMGNGAASRLDELAMLVNSTRPQPK